MGRVDHEASSHAFGLGYRPTVGKIRAAIYQSIPTGFTEKRWFLKARRGESMRE
jgi:hypothetical protein